MVEYVPAFTSVTLYYDIMRLLSELGGTREQEEVVYPFELAAAFVRDELRKLEGTGLPPSRVIQIPVCYGGELGPDLTEVAEHHGLTPEEVIEIHTSADYLVYMLGFAPGFAYLGGMSERIATPRRQTPRLSIPAGTVGIAGIRPACIRSKRRAAGSSSAERRSSCSGRGKCRQPCWGRAIRYAFIRYPGGNLTLGRRLQGEPLDP